MIRSSLPEAVEACVDAAGYEFDISLQRTLLRSASYGQTFARLVGVKFIMIIYKFFILIVFFPFGFAE